MRRAARAYRPGQLPSWAKDQHSDNSTNIPTNTTSINQSTNQANNPSVNRSINHSANQPVSRSGRVIATAQIIEELPVERKKYQAEIVADFQPVYTNGSTHQSKHQLSNQSNNQSIKTEASVIKNEPFQVLEPVVLAPVVLEPQLDHASNQPSDQSNNHSINQSIDDGLIARRRRARLKREQEEREQDEKQQQLIESINQPNQQIKHEIVPSTSTSINQPTSQSIYQSINQSFDQPIEQSDEDYESDDSEPELVIGRLAFAPSAARSTLVERDAQYDEDARGEAEDVERAATRKLESLAHAKAEMARAAAELEAEQKAAADAMPDDSDETADPEAEYAAWQLRELRRIERDRARQAEFDASLADHDDDESSIKGSSSILQDMAADDLKRPIEQDENGDKSSMKFLQKYYHKGAFFSDTQSVDPVFQRDFSTATGADRTVDKSLLPAAMQVKKFGLRGQTKWTHLAAEDTSKLRDRSTRVPEPTNAGRAYSSKGNR